jgi:uncharacterized protein YtpQ (UPF0354 family)
MSGLSREQFVEQIFQVVPARFPLVKLARSAEPFSLAVNGHVVSLENLYRLAQLNPEDVRRHIERWMVELLRAAEGAPDRDASFDELKERIYPMILPEWAGDAHRETVMQPLIEGLNVGYAIDSDRTIAYLHQAQFKQWDVTVDDVHAAAIANLVARSESMPATAAQDEDGSISLIIFQTGDGYDASRILLPSLHERLVEHLGSPFAAGIPNRDILLCFRDDEATIARIRGQISEDFDRMPHQLTDQLLLVTPDGIARRG